MVSKLRHKNDTKQFSELTNAEQAKSISAQIMNLQAAINHHVSNSENKIEASKKCISQVARLLQRCIDKNF